MKNLVAIFAIFAFTVIAVFGFLAIGHGAASEHAGCLAAAATRQSDCPGVFNPIAEAIFHTSAFKNFSTAVLSFSTVLFAALVCIAVLFLRRPQNIKNLYFVPISGKILDKNPGSYEEKVSRWLSRLQNSPSR